MQRRNFGRNQVLKPSAFYTPADEQEILQILDRHRGQRSRRLIRLAFRRIIPAFLIRNWKVTDLSSSMLVMKHDAWGGSQRCLQATRDRSRVSWATPFPSNTYEENGPSNAQGSIVVEWKTVSEIPTEKGAHRKENRFS